MLKEHKKTFSPYVAIVGTRLLDSNNYYLIYDETSIENAYVFTSLTEAVDVCLQIHMAFDIHYCKISDHVWKFLQLYILQIKHKDVPRYSTIDLAMELNFPGPVILK